VITILFYVTVKSGHEAQFYEIAAELTKSTHEKDAGCLAYVWHRREDSSAEFVLYEQWQNQGSVAAHLDRIQSESGPPESGQFLPAAILSLCETTAGISYDVVA
jgi:quinol monooxygenase YgiN